MGLTVCVYCASSRKTPAAYAELARAFGRALGEAGHALVYGGGGVGMMGELAAGAQAAGARVTGVIPRRLVEAEAAYERADELIVTEGMHERKARMAERADGFVALPGGFGTLEELFETLTQRLLGGHDKPLALLNHEGFYDPLLAFFDRLYEEGFAREKSRGHFHVAPTIPDALAAVA